MIYLVTGVPGAGKTLMSILWLEGWLSEGRPCYANIAGLSMPGVEKAPEDWRDAPEGSVWVYDEVQQLWPSTGRAGQADREDIRALETHRHTGHDIVIATQHPTLVHHHVRKLVGKHVHLERHGNKTASVFERDQAWDIADKFDRMNADKRLWRYPKRLFSYYQSATAHTHKFKIPRKLLLLFFVIVGLLSIAAYAITNVDYTDPGGLESEEESSARADSGHSDRGRQALTYSGQSARFHMVGGVPDSLDGAPLSQVWRIAGRVSAEDLQLFLLKSIHGDLQRVPGEGWDVVGYRDGLLRARAPGGVIRVSWLTHLKGQQNDDSPKSEGLQRPQAPTSTALY